MSDLNHQDILPVANALSPKPVRLASAGVVAPSTFLSVVSGTTQIVSITPPVSGAHMLCFLFATTQSGQWATTGNITSATTTAAANVPQLLVYDPVTAKYYKA